MNAMKTVIVSGGTFGLGQSITVELAQRGYHVVAFGLMQAQVSSTAQGDAGLRDELAQHGCSADILEADVSDAAAVERVVAHALSRQVPSMGWSTMRPSVPWAQCSIPMNPCSIESLA